MLGDPTHPRELSGRRRQYNNVPLFSHFSTARDSGTLATDETDSGGPVVVIVCRELRSAVFSRRLARSTHTFPLSFQHDRPRNGQCPKALRNTGHGLLFTPTIGRRMLCTLLSFAGTWRYIIHVGFLCSRFSVNIRRRAVACPPPLWIDKFA